MESGSSKITMRDFAKEASGDKPLLMTESISPLPSISEVDRELAQAAHQEFELRNYDLCFHHLRNLFSNRPQDAKVLHNMCVAEYYLSNFKDTGTFRKNLQDVSKQVHLMFDNVEILEVDHCVLFYNQAVLLYHLNQHDAAIDILDKVFQFIEPLDEVFAKKVCFLLLELYLSTFQPKKAHGLIGYMETMLFVNKSNQNGKPNEKDSNKDGNKDSKENGSFGDVLKPRLQQYKARCFAMMKTAKACKREIKGLMSPSLPMTLNILAFYLKSQLEYQRGNYRKALKILSSPTLPEDTNSFFRETGICLPAIFYNNVGCVHFCMGKPHLGSLYFGRAFQEYESTLKNSSDGLNADAISSRPLHNLCLVVRYPLLYNLGVQYLHSGNYQKAFDCFSEVVKVYHRNPRLWLRLAECCICICKSRNEDNCLTSQLKKNLVKSSTGFGIHRKIILASSLFKVHPNNSNTTNDSMANLEFACMCLHNALNLLPEETVPSSTEDMSSPARKTNEETDGSQVQEGNCIQALPTCPVQGIELSSLRNSILVASSYVSLCLGDINMSYKFAEKLLSQPRLSGAHRFLGHLYAAESLILMDRITEAIEHLKPEHVTDTTLLFPVPSDEAKNTDKVEEANKSNIVTQSWYPNNLSTAKVISHFNLTVAYTLREEWDKANECLRQVFAAKNQDTEIPNQAYLLAVYIKLQQGFADKAKGFVKQYLPQYR